MSIQTKHIKTTMGRVNCFGDNLHFLTEEEHKEFDTIGSSGKNSKGEKTTYTEYLNSLGKGEFQVTQTKFDNGDFREEYTIVRVF